MSASTHPPLENIKTQTPSGPPPVRKKRTGWIWLLVALAVGALAWYLRVPAPAGGGPAAGKKGGKGKGAAGDIPVSVGKAHRGNVPVYLDGLGSVSAFYTVLVRTRVDGQLMSFSVKEGDFVQEGQLIAQVDPRPFQVMLDVAQGTMAHDMALLADAKLDLDRYQTLLKQDAIPKQQLDTQAALVAQYEGSIKTDQANIDNAKLQLTYAKVTAPITGRIGLRQMDPGNIVHATDTTGLVIITQLQPIAVLFTIPEDSLPQVLTKLRAGASLQVDAYNRDKTQKLATGKLLTIDNTIDATTGTSKLKAIFDNTQNELFPNQFVNIRLLVDTLQNQVIVPEVAVQQGSQGQFVYVVDAAAKVKVQIVHVGITEGIDAQILGGLAAGDTVVTDGTDKLQDGSKVRIRDISGASAGAPGTRPGKKKGGAPKAAAPDGSAAQSPDDGAGAKKEPGKKGTPSQ